MNPGWKRHSWMLRFRYFFLLLIVCVSGFFITVINRATDYILLTNSLISASWEYAQYKSDNVEGRFTIKTLGCSIPLLFAFDKNIKPFVKYPMRMRPCHDQNITLLVYNKTQIAIKKENIHYYNVTDAKNIICCYQAFYRPTTIEDITSATVDHRVKYKECLYFNDAIEVQDEFVRVSCYLNATKIYEQFYLSTIKKDFLLHDSNGAATHNKSIYNIIILGIDGVSRLNLYRTMPKTISFIQEYGGIDLAGYNKVGDNTFPNVIPLLLGIKETELKQTCVPYTSASFDNCPFIWEWFKQAGYYTALAEDSSSLGTFNYLRYGFSRTPTDYYTHTFMHEAEKNVGYNKDFNSFLCMNDNYFYKVLLDYVENLTITLKDSKLFGFFWEVTMSHDYLNYPMVMDDSYFALFKRLEASNYLNETIVLLMSDHGLRWSPIRSTKQGRLEERLPFMIVMLPRSFRDNYSLGYEHFKLNSRRLTTPFDVHETLMDLVNLNNIKNNVLSARSNEPYAHKRGISLFLPIPKNRTCEMAGIDDHWCTCHKGSVLPKNSSEALNATSYLIRYLNELISEYPKCARLTLDKILEITEMEAGKPDKKEVGWREFMVVIQSSPGKGVFEATLRHDSFNWIVTGSVSRLNLYGDQSLCVHDYRLKLYCYCIS